MIDLILNFNDKGEILHCYNKFEKMKIIKFKKGIS